MAEDRDGREAAEAAAAAVGVFEEEGGTDGVGAGGFLCVSEGRNGCKYETVYFCRCICKIEKKQGDRKSTVGRGKDGGGARRQQEDSKYK